MLRKAKLRRCRHSGGAPSLRAQATDPGCAVRHRALGCWVGLCERTVSLLHASLKSRGHAPCQAGWNCSSSPVSCCCGSSSSTAPHPVAPSPVQQIQLLCAS